VTVWPARTAAAIVLGLTLTSIAAPAPSVSAAGQPAPVSVTMIAPITVPARTTGLIDAARLANYTAEFGVLTRALDQVIDRPIALGIDPAIIASIRVLGTDAPPSALAWLERLSLASNETFPLAYADADLALGLEAGSGVPLAPLSFDFAIRADRFSAETVDEAPTPAATTAPDEVPPLPTSESLVAWNYTVPSIVWPAMGAVAASSLATLGQSFDTVVLSSDNVGSWRGPVAHATVDSVNALVADSALSAQFAATVSSSSEEWAAAVAGLTAAIAAVPSTDDAPASVLIAVDRTLPLSSAQLGTTISAIVAEPGIAAGSLSALLAAPPTTAALIDSGHDPEAISRASSLLHDEREVRSYAEIADDPLRITSDRRLKLLSTLAIGWQQNRSGWQTAVATYRADSIALRHSVRIVKSSTINLWADRASLPVTIANDLNQPITVFVTVRPLSPLIRVEDSWVEVTVAPRSQAKASVPVQSLSNGTVALEISLHSSSGLRVDSPTYVTTTVQAGWETPVTYALGAVVLLVFAAGVVRTIVRRRRAAAASAESED
jgi:hypothetical protein